MSSFTRRQVVLAAAGTAGVGSFAGCSGGTASDSAGEASGMTAQATFFVFDDIAASVAGETATAALLVPIGQHGHGWAPGPRVREDIREADLLVHGMEGFQPWVDDIRGDLDDVVTVDASAGLDLLEASHGHDEEDGHHHDEKDDGHDHDEEDGHDHDNGAVDPHFWMDPLRVADAVGTVRQGFVDVDADNSSAYADNAEAYRERLEDLHERVESTVADASKEVILVAGHDAFQYLGDRYGLDIRALTNVSPDDRPTPRDIDRAQEIIEAHDLSYICVDPLESQQAADQLVAETDTQEVLSLTAMPGLTDEWDEQGWGYVEVMENVNLPTLERALEA